MSGERKNEALLRDWVVVDHPRTGNRHLEGHVFGHKDDYRCPDGLWIHTSNITHLDLDARIAETENTLYTLDGPSWNEQQRHLS